MRRKDQINEALSTGVGAQGAETPGCVAVGRNPQFVMAN